MGKSKIYIIIGLILCIGGIIANLPKSGTLTKINFSNIHLWFLGFILDFITTPIALIGLGCLIVGFIQLRKGRQISETHKEMNPKVEFGIKEKIKKDRKLLLMFFLLWIASSGLALQYKKSDFSNLPQEKLVFITVVGIIGLVCLIISSIYVYKMYKWYNSSKAPALVMSIVYLIFAFILPLIPILIGAGIIWQSRKLLIDKQ